MKISRRRAAQLMFAAPAVALAAQDAPSTPSLGACIVATETSLTAEERVRFEKALGGLEGSLKRIRDFTLPPGTAPAMQFRPRKSPRSK
jgi:hypothetical protein